MSDYVIEFDFDDDDFPDHYDELPLWSSAFGNLLLEHLPLQSTRRLLDIGCGTGFPLLELAGRLGERASLTGLDIWYPALKRANRKRTTYDFHKIHLIHYAGGTFPFADGVFDTIISNLGINNFADPDHAMHECYRVMQTGGRIVITTNLVGHMAQFYEIFRAVLIEFGNEDYLHRMNHQEAHRGTIETHSALLTDGGFQIEQIEQGEFVMRYANGSALFRHPLIRRGFLPGWVSVIDPPDHHEIFTLLENRLNHHAQEKGELRLTIPMVYISAIKYR